MKLSKRQRAILASTVRGHRRVLPRLTSRVPGATPRVLNQRLNG